MKKLALAVTVIAFGALMVAGCPEENKASNTKSNTTSNSTSNAAENK